MEIKPISRSQQIDILTEVLQQKKIRDLPRLSVCPRDLP